MYLNQAGIYMLSVHLFSTESWV